MSNQLGVVLKEASPSTRYLLGSFPVAVCDNMRISRCRIVRDEEFRGYTASAWYYQAVCWSNYRQGKSIAEVKETIDLARWRIAA